MSCILCPYTAVYHLTLDTCSRPTFHFLIESYASTGVTSIPSSGANRFPYILPVIIILTKWAFGIIKIMEFTTSGTLLLRQPFFRILRHKEFQPSALRTTVNLHLHCTCQQIWKVTQKPSRLPKLHFLGFDVIDFMPAAQTSHVFHYISPLHS